MINVANVSVLVGTIIDVFTRTVEQQGNTVFIFFLIALIIVKTRGVKYSYYLLFKSMLQNRLFWHRDKYLRICMQIRNVGGRCYYPKYINILSIKPC